MNSKLKSLKPSAWTRRRIAANWLCVCVWLTGWQRPAELSMVTNATHTHTPTHAHMCTQIHVHTHTRTQTHARKQVDTHTHTHNCERRLQSGLKALQSASLEVICQSNPLATAASLSHFWDAPSPSEITQHDSYTGVTWPRAFKASPRIHVQSVPPPLRK